jgi:hypothetical protein
MADEAEILAMTLIGQQLAQTARILCTANDLHDARSLLTVLANAYISEIAALVACGAITRDNGVEVGKISIEQGVDAMLRPNKDAMN